MYREPGMPVYLRAPSRVLVAIGCLAFGCAMVYLGARQSWVLVLVLCFGVAITLMALARMEWAILGLVVMANVDGFLKPLFAERFGLFLKDYFILLALVRWAWGLLLGEERASLRTAVAIPAALFIGYVFAEIANPNSPSLLASLAGVRAWIMWIPVFFVAYDYMRSRVEIERLWIAATVISGLVAAYGIVQYFIGFEHLYALSDRFQYLAKMGYLTEGGTVMRVPGTMVHPGTFGAAMGFMVLGASAIAFGSRSYTARAAALAALPVIIIGLFLSGARSAIVGSAIGVALFCLFGRRPVLLLGAGLLILGGFWKTVQLTGGGIEQRLETVTWDYAATRTGGPLSRGFAVALNHPFGVGVASGTGLGSLEMQPGATTGLFVENDFGRAMAELGAGALLYFLLLAAAGVAAIRAYMNVAEGSSIVMSAALIGAMGGVAATLAAGAALYTAPGAPYFWLALASVLRLPAVERERQAGEVAEATDRAAAEAAVAPAV